VAIVVASWLFVARATHLSTRMATKWQELRHDRQGFFIRVASAFQKAVPSLREFSGSLL
jgi:hypothetical protein